jgi:hypothetical protein
MVTQIKPVLCPKCKKSVLGIGRSWRGGSKLVTVEVHHHEDAKRVAAGHTASVCTFKMKWDDSQDLANSLTRDLGNRK